MTKSGGRPLRFRVVYGFNALSLSMADLCSR